MIAKGPKVGRLFPLYSSLSPCSFLPFISCNSATVNFQLWHKRLGHPNSNVLHDLMEFRVLGNKHSPSFSVVQFDCNSCKLGKRKILPFPIHQSNVNKPFDIIHNDLWGITLVISLMHITSILSLLLTTIVVSHGLLFAL